MLPSALRAAVDRALEGVALADLAAAAATLSDRYRAEVRDGRAHLAADMAARAYLAVRLPATFAAVKAALEAAAEAAPGFAPATLLDVGAGPGTAAWAAAEVWGGLAGATMIEASAAIRRLGEDLAKSDPPAGRMDWKAGDAATELATAAPADLVTAAYMINELAPAGREAVVDRLWALTTGLLVIIEPGTSAGWQRILQARARLIAAGGHVLAPCAHGGACPLTAPDWCHFSTRVARSRLHRQAKGAEVGWEDEKSIYLVVSRAPAGTRAARVLAPPRTGKGHVSLKVCRPDGTAGEMTISRRDGDLWRIGRKLDWGDQAPG